jgi:CheY-like chemotaxis protein
MALILIVDDNEENAYMLRSLLHGHGYRVESARNGAEALDAAAREHPDLVISDILMPVMDGFSLCRAWKQDETLRGIPFVFYTATYTEPQDEQLALNLGAERFIIKPTEPDRFIAILSAVLEQHRQGQLQVREGSPPAETQYLREYNAALIRKLEHKLFQLEEKSRALAEKDAVNHAVIDAMPALVAVVGPQGVVLSLNQAWSRFSQGDLGPAFLRLDVGDDLLAEGEASRDASEEMRLLQHGLRAVLQGHRPDQEIEIQYGSTDDDRRWFMVRIERVGKVGIGVVMACIDITDRKRSEVALRETSRRKDEFLALLGHELRNPLAPIRLATGILGRPNLEPNHAERVRGVIDRQVTHLARIVDELLDVSRIGRGTMRLERASVDCNLLLRTVTEDWRAGFESRGVSLALELPSEHVWIDGDATRLTQVVGNLLANSQKFTPSGGTVEVRLALDEHRPSWSRWTVRDSGAGMTSEMLARIFQPFEQAPDSIARTRGGVGLGLALVKGLVELHGGHVRASSPGPGLGTEIEMRFPLTKAPSEHATSGPPEPVRLRHTEVLVIEDNRDMADSLQDFLEGEGCAVRVAYDGPSGLSSARAQPPQIVLCDIGLPGMDGYAVAQAFRTDPKLQSARLVAVTGYGQAEDRRRAEQAGFDAHVTKPPDPRLLLALLAGAGDAPAPPAPPLGSELGNGAA